MGGVTTKPTAAEHLYSVASQEERRKERSRRKGQQREEGKEIEGREQSGLLSELARSFHATGTAMRCFAAAHIPLLN